MPLYEYAYGCTSVETNVEMYYNRTESWMDTTKNRVNHIFPFFPG